MTIPILISLSVIVATIFIHSIGSALWINYLGRKFIVGNNDFGFGRSLRILSSTAVLLMIIHYLGIMLWAGIFLSLPALDKITHWEEAIYFSMVTYTTLGYGDITLPPVWRVMSGFEAMNGILLFGWSTAMFYAVVQKLSTKVNRST